MPILMIYEEVLMKKFQYIVTLNVTVYNTKADTQNYQPL